MLTIVPQSCNVIGASLSEPQYSKWYVRRVHENLPHRNGLPHTLGERASRSRKFTARKRTLRSRKFASGVLFAARGYMAEREQRLNPVVQSTPDGLI